MVQQLIIEQLKQSDEVVIPGLGGFQLQYAEARYDAEKNQLIPPGKVPVFSESHRFLPSKLVPLVAQRLGQSEYDAGLQVAAWVEEVRAALATAGSYTLEGLGTLRQNQQFELSFQADQQAQLANDSYGLPTIALDEEDGASTPEAHEVTTDPVEETQPEEEPAKPTAPVYEPKEEAQPEPLPSQPTKPAPTKAGKKKEKPAEPEAKKGVPLLAYVLWGLVVVVAAVVVYQFGIMNEKKKQGPVVEIITVPAGDSTATESAAASQEPAAEPAKTYHIIAGGFSSSQNAEVLLKEFKSKGFDSQILPPSDGKNLYRVAVFSYPSLQAAQQDQERVEKMLGKKLWILAQ